MQQIDAQHPVAGGSPKPTWDVAKLFPAQGMWSEEEYLQLDTNLLVEFNDGHVEVLPMPSDRHQAIVIYLLTQFLPFFQRLGGIVRVAPLRLQLWPGKFREPDLLFLLDADDPRRQERYWTGADFVIEVVSADDPRRDRLVKREEYARAGISEYWIVDPQTESVTVLWLKPDDEGDGYAEHGRYGRGETARSALLDKLMIDVDAVLDAP